MYRIDSVIENLSATLAAMKKVRSAAEEADLPADELLAMEKSEAELKAMLDRMHDLGHKRGAEEAFAPLKKLELDPSRIRERRTED